MKCCVNIALSRSEWLAFGGHRNDCVRPLPVLRRICSQRSCSVLAFVTAVRHPLNSKSFSRVGALLDATLHSVCRQVDQDFRVIVVNNELPPLSVSSPKVIPLRVTFPPPTSQRTARVSFTDGVRDKGCKLAAGVAAARQMSADHVMFIDCDDLLHHGLSHYANLTPQHPGWFSPSGFIHTVGSRTLQYVATDFHHLNGSTSMESGLPGLISAASRWSLCRSPAPSGRSGLARTRVAISCRSATSKYSVAVSAAASRSGREPSNE
ncbi:unannotated protein [freshwater metagenome]|uniref:Unannotated protein n=1 Tax=freshwater metagenome TaxID=449393 RepID=A0A6J7CUQ4_9ZZZZ